MHPYLVKAIMDEHIRDLNTDLGIRRLWKIRTR
jgi:hypothetical protein